MSSTSTYPRGSHAWLVLERQKVDALGDLLERQWGWLGANEGHEQYEVGFGKTVETLKRYCAAWDAFVEGGGTDG
jgi:hypothetical protein